MGVKVNSNVVVNADSYTISGTGDEITISSPDGKSEVSCSASELADGVREYCRSNKIRFGAPRGPRKKKGEESEAAA